uniref:Peptide deformylase n=1 Tax=candidate division CPR3 bacterium TaxID=2268181 RepID=A0A7C4M2W8_UNCC3
MKVKLIETKNPKNIPEILREKSKEVKKITPEILNLAKQMIRIMNKNNGIGISAIQVGVPIQMIVVKNCDQDFIFFNPKITSFSKREVVYNEGCLSFPGIFENVSRPEKVKIEAKNIDWEDTEIEADGILARCLLHEIDHLVGVLFIDHI